MRDITVLVTASGAPGTAALLRALRLNGERGVRIVGTDMSPQAVGRHFCDRFYVVPRGNDPAFDRDCFSPDGKSFDANLATAATDPMACGRTASEYRPYASRARWVRTANDSYFTTMSYPQGVSVLQPVNIHDATWGVLSAVYGGAIHPTAQGHAAMADAALPAMREVLGVRASDEAARGEPLRLPSNISAPITR